MRNPTNYNTTMRDFVNWTDAMNRVFNGPQARYDYAGNGGSNGATNNNGTTDSVTLPVDVWATEDAFQIAAYLPGIEPDAVEITMEGDELTIRGELATDEAEKEYLKRELFRGSFVRRISFNVPVDVDKIEANFKNGLLTLSVPKAEVARPKLIKVNAQ